MAGLAAKLDPLNLEFVAENLKVPWGKNGGWWGMARGSHLPLNQLGSHLPLNQVGRSCFRGECDPGLGANVTSHFVWEAQ